MPLSASSVSSSRCRSAGGNGPDRPQSVRGAANSILHLIQALISQEKQRVKNLQFMFFCVQITDQYRKKI